MRVLHIASFNGNVGDNANHKGLRRMLSKVLPGDTEYDELEIRRIYLNYDGRDKLQFDNKFAELVNKYDLAIIGGGNFFEVWIEKSATGCTIDIEANIIEAIRTKILFFGLGFDKYKGYSERTLQKFYDFINSIRKSNILISFRNDGSCEQYIESFGSESFKFIKKVPDGGFFVDPAKCESMVKKDHRNVVLSLAKDMLEVRFGKDKTKENYQLFINDIIKYITDIFNEYKDLYLIFVPHIYSDLAIISDVISNLPDFIRRNYLAVAPYLSGSGAEDEIVSIYRDADLVVGMRFHANVCAIGLGTPTIGLSTYKKISDLYFELGLQHRLIIANNESIHDSLLEKTKMIFNNKEIIKAENINIMQKLNGEMNDFLMDLKSFIIE